MQRHGALDKGHVMPIHAVLPPPGAPAAFCRRISRAQLAASTQKCPHSSSALTPVRCGCAAGWCGCFGTRTPSAASALILIARRDIASKVVSLSATLLHCCCLPSCTAAFYPPCIAQNDVRTYASGDFRAKRLLSACARRRRSLPDCLHE